MTSCLGEERQNELRIEKLHIDAVLRFEGTNLLQGTLHDLCYGHQAVDLVDYVKSESNSTCFLVFLQLSLSKYTEHTGKLDDLLRSRPKEMYVKDESEERFNSFEFFALRASYLLMENLMSC